VKKKEVIVADKKAEEEGGWVQTLGGRKFVLPVVGMAAVITVAFIRSDFPTDKVIESITWLIGIGVGGIAVENGLARAAARKG
jgi:hypothetical protein